MQWNELEQQLSSLGIGRPILADRLQKLVDHVMRTCRLPARPDASRRVSGTAPAARDAWMFEQEIRPYAEKW